MFFKNFGYLANFWQFYGFFCIFQIFGQTARDPPGPKKGQNLFFSKSFCKNASNYLVTKIQVKRSRLDLSESLKSRNNLKIICK